MANSRCCVKHFGENGCEYFDRGSLVVCYAVLADAIGDLVIFLNISVQNRLAN